MSDEFTRLHIHIIDFSSFSKNHQRHKKITALAGAVILKNNQLG